MAGRKQHYIPQLLLRGFGRSGGGKSTQVWVYSATRGKYRSATEGVGAQREFYSEPATASGTVTLDDQITDHEQQLGPGIEALRRLDPESEVDAREAAEMVAHLTIRVSHIREVFSSAFIDMLDSVEDRLLDPGALMKYLKLRENPPGKIVRDGIRSVWVERRTELVRSGYSQDRFERWMLDEIRSKGDGLLADSTPLVSVLMAEMRRRAAEVMRESHKRALAKTLVPEPRVTVLKALEWTVQAGPPLGCILPDCVAVAMLDGGDCLPLVFADSDRISSVAMPLCHDKMLVGDRRGKAVEIVPEPMFAAACWDFFVAREDDADHDAAMPLLGRRIRSHLEKAVHDGTSDLRLP